MTRYAQLAVWSLSLLVSIWLGYPLLVAGLARLARLALRRRPDGSTSLEPYRPFVSVIMATREADAVVADRVSDVFRSSYPGELLEIVVGLDRVEETAGALCARVADPRVVVVVGDAPGGKATALNAAVRAARGEVLIFSDARQRFDEDSIAALVAPLRDPRIGAASGCLDIPPRVAALPSPTECYWLLERWLREREAELHSTVGVTGAVWALRRSLWLPLRAGLILDDVFTPMRLVLAGYRVAFVRAARAVDDRRFSAAQEYRRKVRTLTGVLQLCAWLPGVLVPWRNPIWLQFVAHKLLRLLSPYLALACAVGLVGALSISALRPDTQAGFMAAGTAIALVAWPSMRGRLGRALTWSLAIQAALVVATANGLRGRWDVWR